jgi:protoporphyrinogen oxidase
MANDTSIPHIVVVGGGFSGATCAKYLKMWGGSSIDVTIIETNQTYVSPILSNLVLNGQKTTHSNSRRDFMKFVGASSLFAITPGMANDTSIPHIVVVGLTLCNYSWYGK